jgi:hypothetical protein
MSIVRPISGFGRLIPSGPPGGPPGVPSGASRGPPGGPPGVPSGAPVAPVAASGAPVAPVPSRTSGAPVKHVGFRLPSTHKASNNHKSTKHVDKKTLKSAKNDFIRKLGIKLTSDQDNTIEEFMNKVLIEKSKSDRTDSKEIRIRTEKDKTERLGFTDLDPKKFNEYIDNTPGIAELDLESPSNLIGNAKKIVTDREWQRKILEEYELIKKDMNMPDIYDFSR